MSLWILQPDAQGNCCDCAGRTEPCDSCGACGVCTVECVRAGTTVINNQTTPCTIGPLNDTECVSYNINRSCNGAPALVSGKVQTRLVITGLTAGIQTTAHIFFSDGTQHDFVFTPTDTSYTTEYVAVPFPALNADAISVAGCSVDCPICVLNGGGYTSPVLAQDAINTLGTCYSLVGPGMHRVPPNGPFTPNTVVSTSSSFVNNILKISYHTSWPGDLISSDLARASISLLKDSLLSVTCDAPTWAYVINGTPHDGTAGNIVTFSVPETQTYDFFFTMLNTDGGGNSISGTMTISCNAPMAANPLIVFYDDSGTDSGTARQLEACPKLEIPVQAIETGSWYANQVGAQEVINNLTSNCIGFIRFPGEPGFGTFTANGSSSLTLNWISNSTVAIVMMFGSLNLQAGAILSTQLSSFRLGGIGISTEVIIYDAINNIVESVTAGNGTITSSPLPATGRYTIEIHCSPPNDIISVKAILTSNRTLSINPIQALYDVGLDCPARLNCS